MFIGRKIAVGVGLIICTSFVISFLKTLALDFLIITHPTPLFEAFQLEGCLHLLVGIGVQLILIALAIGITYRIANPSLPSQHP